MPKQRTITAGISAPVEGRSRDATLPFSETEAARAEQVSRRLAGELRTLINGLPRGTATSAGLSRLLSMNRTIAHRILAAAEDGVSHPPLHALLVAPGVEALRQFVDRAGNLETPPPAESLVAARAAVEAFSELIRAYSGSHARLIARIEASRPEPAGSSLPAGRDPESRRTLFETVRDLSGRMITTRTSISIVRPIPGDPDNVEYVFVTARIGQRARPDALPHIALSALYHKDAASRDPGPTEHRSLDNRPLEPGLPLLEEFTGRPRPIVTTLDNGKRLLHHIEGPLLGQGPAGWAGEPDLVMAHRVPLMGASPLRQDPAVYSEVHSVVGAVERNVMDVYLHRSLAGQAVPSMGVYFGHRVVNCDLTDRWFDLLKGVPILELLGPGISAAATDAYPRHPALTQHVFERLAASGPGWSPDDFVGFRSDEKYPLWGCDYVMSFDFRRAVADPLE